MLVHLFFSALHLTLVSCNHSPLLPNRLFPPKSPLFPLSRHSFIQNIYGTTYLYLILQCLLAYESAKPTRVLPCTRTYRCWPLFLALAQLKIFKVYLFCNKSPLSSMTVSKGHLALLSIPSFRFLFQGIE